MSSTSNCLSLSLAAAVPAESDVAPAPLLATEPGVKGVALERIVCVTGISRGTVAGFGDGRGDDGAEAGGGVDSSAGWGYGEACV